MAGPIVRIADTENVDREPGPIVWRVWHKALATIRSRAIQRTRGSNRPEQIPTSNWKSTLYSTEYSPRDISSYQPTWEESTETLSHQPNGSLPSMSVCIFNSVRRIDNQGRKKRGKDHNPCRRILRGREGKVTNRSPSVSGSTTSPVVFQAAGSSLIIHNGGGIHCNL